MLQDDPSILAGASLIPLFFLLSYTILACWYLQVSARRHYSLPFHIRSSVFAQDDIHVPCCYSFLIHSSFMVCILCRNYTLFIYHIHLSLTSYTHSSLYASHSSLVHASDSVTIHVPAVRLFHLSFSCVTFICRTHLRSCISHRARRFLDLFFSLSCIKFQDS